MKLLVELEPVAEPLVAVAVLLFEDVVEQLIVVQVVFVAVVVVVVGLEVVWL
jgi:hypothetical protein